MNIFPPFIVFYLTRTYAPGPPFRPPFFPFSYSPTTPTPTMFSALRSSVARQATSASTISRVAKRGYADAVDGALKLSLVLPHQVSGVLGLGVFAPLVWSLLFSTLLFSLLYFLGTTDYIFSFFGAFSFFLLLFLVWRSFGCRCQVQMLGAGVHNTPDR